MDFLGIFIGSSFVFKKKGLLQSTEKTGIFNKRYSCSYSVYSYMA